MRHRLGQVSPRYITRARFTSHNIEILEDRIAPGCVLDFIGLVAAEFSSGLASSMVTNVSAHGGNGAAAAPNRGFKPYPNVLPTASPIEQFGEVVLSSLRANRQRHDGTANLHDGSATHITAIDDVVYSQREGLADDTFRPDSVFSIPGPLTRPEPGFDGEEFVSNDRNQTSLQLAAKVMIGSALSMPTQRPQIENGNSDSGFLSAPMKANMSRSNSPGVDLTATANVLSPETDAAAEAGIEDARVPRGLPYARGTDPIQSKTPYAITYAGARTTPTTGVVRSPAEYDPMRGVLFSYRSYTSIVTDMVKELTEDPTKDDIAYVVVSSVAQQNSASTSFINAGADMSKVEFFIEPSDSVWMRDYGPHFVSVDDALAIVDSHYYPSRPQDNYIPTLIGDNHLDVPTYDMGLYYSGGNFQPGPNNSGFVTSLVNYHNTTTDGFDADFISELYNKYQGIDTLHVLPQLPFSVDATGHIDMWMYLVDEDTVIISEFQAGSNSTAIQITNDAATYMENLGFDVHRPQAWNVGSTHYTYANAFRVNDRIFVPVYGTALKPGGNPSYNDEDAAAIATWQAAAGPGVEIIPIQSSQIIPAAGAIHCIVMQVPRYTGSAPAANVISPAGGELLLRGSQHTIEWSAIDTNNTDPTEIGIFVSYNGGGSYQHLATTTDTGSYVWTVNGRATSNAVVKVVATSADSDQVEVFSEPFTIAAGIATTYDFSSGAGVDKFGFGSQTAAWANIDSNPSPVGSQLNSQNYTRISTSNAVGSDSDINRYIAPVPSPTGNESTHTFSFHLSEAVSKIDEIDVQWEGYADFCTQVELYVWDLVAQNWGDATGLTGNNRYLDSWAGNADGLLSGSIRSDFSRYVDGSGTIQFLVYADRTGTNPDTQHNAGQGIETFHDYMSVTVKQIDARIGQANFV